MNKNASHRRSDRVYFHRIGLAGIDEMNTENWKMLTLSSLMKYLGHENVSGHPGGHCCDCSTGTLSHYICHCYPYGGWALLSLIFRHPIFKWIVVIWIKWATSMFPNHDWFALIRSHRNIFSRNYLKVPCFHWKFLDICNVATVFFKVEIFQFAIIVIRYKETLSNLVQSDAQPICLVRDFISSVIP